MKKYLPLLLGCLASGWAQAQTPALALWPDSVTQRLTRVETVLVPGASQAALLARAQAWLAAAYQTTPLVPPAAAVQGTGWREIEMRVSDEKSLPLNLWYTVTIAVAPGRYRYAISELQTQHEATPADPTPARQALELVIGTDPAPLPISTDYAGQAAEAAQAVAETIKSEMAAARPGASG